jgi:hypothetical protein
MTALANLERQLGVRRSAHDHPVAKWTLGGRFFMADGSPYTGDDLVKAEAAVIEVTPAPKPAAKKRAGRPKKAR